MDSRNNQAIALARQDEREGGREEPIRDGHINYHHYHIGQANNPNFGPIYGNLNQNMHWIASPSPGYELAAGGYTQSMAGTDVLSLLNPILDASHTRNMKHSPPNSQCLPGTRKAVIRDIQTWADSDDLEANPHIMWIYGYAGCGKSAIAHEMAKLCDQQGRLAACFVFFRGSGDRSTSAKFAITVASQVAAAFPATVPLIESALRRNPGISSTTTAPLSHQFEKLVYLPIHDIASELRAAVIIVLDGADECRDRDDMSNFIEDMIQFFEKRPDTPLRFLITSRVEDHLRRVLRSSSQVQLLNLAEQTSDDDISVALGVAMNAKRSRRFACDTDWPDGWERQKLVRLAEGNFLFMSLIINRISDPNLKDGRTPRERLALALSKNTELDDLYALILTPCQNLPYFHAVISTIVLAFQPLSVVQLAEILNIKTVNVLDVLIDLQSIIQVPGDDRAPVTLYHTSLRDFLCTEKRSGLLFAKAEYHLCLAYWGSRAGFPSKALPTRYTDQFAMRHLQEFLTPVNSPVPGDVLHQLNGTILKDRRTALEAASYARKWTIGSGLARAGADDVDVQFREPEEGAICALHAACYRKEWDLVYLLLEKGANPNVISPYIGVGGFNDGTPLAFAAWEGDVKPATRLLECRADPNLQGGYWGTALRAACARGSLEIVELLLEHGAHPNLGGRWGSAPLHTCAANDREDCARALLMLNADPNPQDTSGDTPLHYACYNGKVRVVECLLEFKADASIKNKRGQTALQVAQEQGEYRVVELLGQHVIHK